jgi:hypothetical protein
MLWGCPVDEDPNPSDPADSDVEDTDGDDTDTDSEPPPYQFPDPVTCGDVEKMLELYEVPRALEGLEDCLATDPSDADALFGHAVVSLLLVSDWQVPQDVLSACAQPMDATDVVYGMDGAIQELQDRMDGDAQLTVTYDDGTGSTQSVTAFDDSTNVQVESYYDTWEADDVTRVHVGDDFSDWNGFSLEFTHNDVYQDGSGVKLEQGLEVKLKKVLDTERVFWMYLDCDQPGSGCYTGYEDFNNDFLDGTVTFTKWDPTPGADVELEFNMSAGAYCDSSPCSSFHQIVGTVTDEMYGEYDVTKLPFGDVSLACDINNCDDMAFLTEVDALCDVTDFAEATEWGLLISDQLTDIAGALEDAAADDSVQFRFPHANAVWLEEDLRLNQTDALTLAAALHGAAAGVSTALQYNVFDEAEAPDDLVQSYTCKGQNLGVPRKTLVDGLNDNLGQHRAGADFGPALDSFDNLIATLIETVEAEPTSEGITDYSTASTTLVDYRNGVISDLEVLADALSTGKNKSLATAPGFELTIGKILADPPNMDDFFAATGEDWVASYDGDCDDYVYFNEELGTWALEEDLIGIIIPEEWYEGDGKSCNTTANCESGESCYDGVCLTTAPSALDPIWDTDFAEELVDSDDWPYFVNSDVVEWAPWIDND